MARLYSDSITMQSAAVATGNGTAVNAQGYATMCIQLSGTMTSLTVTFEATADDTNWVAVQAANANTGAVASTATAAGLYVIPCAGFSQLRARVSTYGSGNVTAVGLGSTVGAGVSLSDLDVSPWEPLMARWGTGASETDELRMDASTHTLQTIDYSHHEIHSGSHFYISGHTTLANEGVLRVKLVTPANTKWAHFSWAISSSGITQADLYEGASGGMAGGSGVTIFNSNRNSLTASGLTITSGVAAANTAGTLIHTAKWGASSNKIRIGGGASRDDEVILKQASTYLRVFTSGAADNIIQFKAGWYEHTDKD